MTELPDLHNLDQQVIQIVADALNVPADDVHRHSSLVDDLGAESIDFIDIVFRLETAFDTLIPTEELWAGSIEIDGSDPAAMAKGLAQLRVDMPEFAWERFPNALTKRDLPRLITVNTIAGYLRKHLTAEVARRK